MLKTSLYFERVEACCPQAERHLSNFVYRSTLDRWNLCVPQSLARNISKFDRPELVGASEGEEEFEWFDVHPKPT